MKQQTAVEWLLNEIADNYKTPRQWEEVTETAKELEMRLAIAFHNWMKQNDTEQNAEKYFHYSDEDMYNEFLKQWAK